jgi:hypothetical protein
MRDKSSQNGWGSVPKFAVGGALFFIHSSGDSFSGECRVEQSVMDRKISRILT